MVRKVICALDTGDLNEALSAVRRLSHHVNAFKIGHALTLANGLEVVPRLQDAGASRIFLDLKFHDIPNSVGLAVCEASKYGVWMMTLHISGGPAMMTAAVEEARNCGDMDAPLLIGVSVLTSLNEHVLRDHLGTNRSLPEHMLYLSKLAIDCGLDGVVCSPQEVHDIRQAIGHSGVIVTPGIRLSHHEPDDQHRIGDPVQALHDGADYLVIGRALMSCPDVDAALAELGLLHAGSH